MTFLAPFRYAGRFRHFSRTPEAVLFVRFLYYTSSTVLVISKITIDYIILYTDNIITYSQPEAGRPEAWTAGSIQPEAGSGKGKREKRKPEKLTAGSLEKRINRKASGSWKHSGKAAIISEAGKAEARSIHLYICVLSGWPEAWTAGS